MTRNGHDKTVGFEGAHLVPISGHSHIIAADPSPKKNRWPLFGCLWTEHFFTKMILRWTILIASLYWSPSFGILSPQHKGCLAGSAVSNSLFVGVGFAFDCAHYVCSENREPRQQTWILYASCSDKNCITYHTMTILTWYIPWPTHICHASILEAMGGTIGALRNKSPPWRRKNLWSYFLDTACFQTPLTRHSIPLVAGSHVVLSKTRQNPVRAGSSQFPHHNGPSSS